MVGNATGAGGLPAPPTGSRGGGGGWKGGGDGGNVSDGATWPSTADMSSVSMHPARHPALVSGRSGLPSSSCERQRLYAESAASPLPLQKPVHLTNSAEQLAVHGSELSFGSNGGSGGSSESGEAGGEGEGGGSEGGGGKGGDGGEHLSDVQMYLLPMLQPVLQQFVTSSALQRRAPCAAHSASASS